MLENQYNVKPAQEQILLLQQKVETLRNELKLAHDKYEKIVRDLGDSVRSELDYRDVIKRLNQRIQELENK
jgi:hypothetical protein